jgi:hypothetical protein
LKEKVSRKDFRPLRTDTERGKECARPRNIAKANILLGKKKYPERTLNRFGQIQNVEKSVPDHRLRNIARVNISFDL